MGAFIAAKSSQFKVKLIFETFGAFHPLSFDKFFSQFYAKFSNN